MENVFVQKKAGVSKIKAGPKAKTSRKTQGKNEPPRNILGKSKTIKAKSGKQKKHYHLKKNMLPRGPPVING